jgi:hypothetical protein
MERCGIPHLAKNERDVGHPSFAVRRDFQGGLRLPCLETRRISDFILTKSPGLLVRRDLKEVSIYLCAETPRISDFVLTKYPGLLVRRDFEGGLCLSL